MQGRECLVVHVENLHAVAFAHVFHALGLHHVYVGSFFDQVGELEHGREGRAHVQCPLGPIDLLGEAELFQHGAVIGIVVEAGERAQMLETFHQKAFLVHIGESPGTAYVGASPLSAPFGHGVDQRFQNRLVFDEVQPAEADEFLFVIGLVVDDGGHAAHNLTAAIS